MSVAARTAVRLSQIADANGRRADRLQAQIDTALTLHASAADADTIRRALQPDPPFAICTSCGRWAIEGFICPDGHHISEHPRMTYTPPAAP